jgi:hypothetical protein
MMVIPVATVTIEEYRNQASARGISWRVTAFRTFGSV